MAKTKNLGILGADNTINTRKQITRGTSVKPKKGMKYYDLGKKKKKKNETDIRTIKNEDVNKRNTLVNNTPNKDGYIKTNKKYGDYDYHDYSTKKNYDIYKKDNKAYYFDPKTKSYVDMDQQRISTPEIEKKEKKKALKEGFKGNEINKVVEKTKLVPEKQKQFGIDAKNNKKGLMKGKKVVESKKIEQVSPRTFAEQVELDTSGLSKKEKKQFTKDLIAQHKKENKKLSYVREGSATGELRNMFVNPNNNFQKEIAQPLADAERIYRQGKLNNELAMQYYNKMVGKKNDIAGAQRNVDLYNKFNRDLTVDKNGNPVDLGLLGNSIQNLNTQVESLKKQGIVATGGSLLGAGIGAVAGLRGGNPLGGAVAGAKMGAKAGYITGSTPYIYKLEAGNQYKDLLDMGVSDDKAKEISNLTGVINGFIESGENIADLVMLGGGKLAKNAIVKNAISKNESVIGKIIKTLGPKKAQNYLERTYGKEIADVLLKSYGANIVSEGGEEALQETVGIAGKRSAANAEGIEYQNTYRDDFNQILNAAKAGAGTAAIIGGAQAITTNTASFGANKLSQMAEVINQTNNGEITQEQANQKFEQINDGTYQQNQNYQAIANQEYQNLQNQLQSGQITEDQYIQELKNLNETINITREQINKPQNQIETQPQTNETTQDNVITQETQNMAQNEQNKGTQESTFNNEQINNTLTSEEERINEFEKLPTDTEDKLQNFRNSVENERIDDSDGFYKSVEKIIQDKDYNVLLDSSITNEKGQPVNAVISNENGITIRINPKSERAGEILLMHEVTHGIETKEMSDLIMDYASKNKNFNKALVDLKKAYGTEDITPEVIADISGEMFGEQEFINMLSTKNPSLFKKIYDAIMSLANKLTGNSNYDLFYKDLKSKWEKAYRKSNTKSAQQNLKEGARYSQNVEVTDSDGKPLTKDQIDFYEDSKVRDDDGRLIKVYHTVNHPVIQFNEFNPVGTPGYRFDNQVVIYSTSSKKMSGSYSHQVYDMAEGERLNNIKEAQRWLKSVQPDLIIDGLEIAEDYGGGILDTVLSYKTEEELLRNIKSDIQKEYGNEGPLQYEAYLNMKKPYIVEAYKKDWYEVADKLNEVKKEIIDKLEDEHKTEIVELAKESKKKHEEYINGNAENNIKWSSDILRNFKDDKLNNFFEELNIGEDWASLDEALHADDYEDFLSNFEFYHIDSEAMGKAMEERGITEEDFDKMSPEEYEEFEEEFRIWSKGHNFDFPDGETKLSDLIDEETLEFYEEKQRLVPFYKDLKNKTFEEFMNNYLELYDESSYLDTEHAYFDEVLDLDEIFGVGAEDVFEGDTLYKLGESGFDKDIIDTLTKDPLETNDVVKMIIRENKQKPASERYDGIIFKGIYDYGGMAESKTPEDVFVVFNPNQIKSVDNLHPTNDPDWRYSQRAKKWQKFLEENFQNKGTKTILKDKIKKESSKKTIDKTATTNDIVNDFKNAKEGKLSDKKIRSYIETSNKATNMEDTIDKADIDKITYEVKANKDTYEKAQRNIKDLSYDERVARSKNILNSDKKIKAVDMAEAQIALLEAAQSGRVEDYLSLQQDIAIMGTELGQTVQAMSMIQKMSPDGQIATLMKIIKRKQATDSKIWKDVELKPELVQKVLDSYDDASHTTFDKDKMDQAVDELKQDLADQMKVTKTEKLNEWRYLSMLGNPKTHIRNLTGNVAMSVVKVIKDTISAGTQDAAGKLGLIDKTQKTATLKRASKDVKNLSEVAFDEMMKIGDKSGKYNESGIIEEKRQIFNNKVLEFLRKGNLKALNVEDNMFKKVHFKNAFSTYLTAKGIKTLEDINNNPQIVADAKVYAMNEAKIATFQQENKGAKWIRDLDKLGWGAQAIRGAIVPFTGVPMNIAQTGIEYTPVVGMIPTISAFKKVPKGQKGIVLIDGLAKQMTGSSLLILGYALAKSGLVNADAGDDKDDKYKKDLGEEMNYSIKIGDTSYDLSWLSPSAMPFFVGASAYEQWEKREGLDANFITEALASTVDPLSEMSVVESFTKVLSSYESSGAKKIMDAGESTVQSYISQYIPTAFSQFSRALDSKKRNTYADKNSKWTFVEETGKQLAFKTPFRLLLPEQTDYFGKTKMDEKNNVSRALQAFFSPINTRKDTSNKVSKELLKLYDKTGETEIIPSKPDSYLKYNDEKYDMTQKEYNKFKKVYGTTASKEIKRALNDSDYQNLSIDKQTQVISNILKYSKNKAKEDYFESKDVDYTNTKFNKAKQAEKSGYAIADYYITKKVTTKEKSKSTVSTNRYEEMKGKGIDGKTFDEFRAFVSNARADKTANGGYKRGSKKQKIINYINGLPLSAKQKQTLWDDYNENTRYFQYYG